MTCPRTLTRWVKLTLAFHLALVHNRPLALRRFACVKRLAGFRLGRHFVRQRGKHAGTPGHARTGTRTCRNGPGTLAKRTILRTARPTRTSGTWRKWTALSALRTHRLAGTRAARPIARR